MNTINNAAAPDGAAKAPAPEKVDREIPQLKTKRKTKTRVRLAILGVAILAILLLGAGVGTFMKRLKERKEQEAAARMNAKPESSAVPTKTDFEGAKKRIKLEEAAAQPPAAAMAQDANGLAVPAAARSNFADAKNPGGSGAGGSGSQAGGPGNGGAGQPKAAAPRPLTKEQRLLSGDFIVGDEGAGAAGPAAAAPAPQTPMYAGAAPQQSALERDLTPTKISGVAAVRRRNLSMMLEAGATIPCGQYTYIVSDNPGQVFCLVSQDIYSADGSTLLVERGSKVLGQRDKPLQLGQSMMPVLWSRIETPPPHGVVIDINSLATDSLGASGLPVYVDTHFRERFGAAIMLSLISDAGQAAANAASNGGSTIRLSTTAGVGQDLASRALDKTINIPPTGYSLQGSAINIFVARDVDFGRVYELVRY